MGRIILTDKGLTYKDIEDLTGYIIGEHYNQINKWGYQRHTINEWQTIITEEVGEVARHLWEYHDKRTKESLTNLKIETMQVITLYIKLYKMLSAFDNHD